ncbi:DUF4402 domain-containing protein [Aquimarina sp. TRL1]|uniref:DUF4402 domain-containing protein n=1 Tax=Aquimarina sp. (strain TRL1) TaxID=2736252 RepID=UPI00158B8347|nr:DUF4402 domain-containing protein [Aquimarina sp. TRL1]QKX07306.1 DUF4402 domain-containing protein [Aquimarina sp. TRL1]
MATLKLEEITTTYRSFVDDQVLTAAQLNTIIDYFEDQHRLTRVCLSGVGIVCGMKVAYQGGGTITISPGCAVTTDGDLIRYMGNTYTHIKSFEDRDAAYERFSGIDNLIEIVPSSEELQPLSTLEDLERKVVVLYLENYKKEETPCTSTNCDTQGEEHIANIRILLLNPEEVNALHAADTVFSKHHTMEQFLNLPEAAVKRVILSQLNTKKYSQLVAAYARVMNEAPATLSALRNGIKSLFTDFDALLQIEDVVTKKNEIETAFTHLYTFSYKQLPLDIQYRYDLLRDLEMTYEEIKQQLFDLRLGCCTAETAFPKHIVLGELVQEKAYSLYRHSFYPAAIIPDGVHRLQQLKSLLNRIHQMMKAYMMHSVEQIKITPSSIGNSALGERAIPYYYQTTKELIKYWDYNKTRQFKEGYNLAYYPQFLSSLDKIRNPLDYTLEKHNFYRIEGHLGKDYASALREITDLKVQKGLAFDIKVLSIDETLEGMDITDFKCHFEDLNVILQAWLKEQECLYKDIALFFSSFQNRPPWKNTHYMAAGIASETVAAETVSPVIEASETISRNSHLGNQLEKKTLGNVYKRKVYTPLRIVENALNTSETVLGSMIKEAIKKHPDREAETIVKAIDDKVKNMAEIQQLDEDTKAVSIVYPYRLIVYVDAVEKAIPTDVSEISESRLRQFAKATKELCDLVENYQKRLHTALHKKNTVYKRKGYESRVTLLLDQLTLNCCAAEKINVLRKEIEKRKLKILESKSLAKFIERHPGLEHTGGVVPGGTFVLVYKGKEKRKKYPRPLLRAEETRTKASVAREVEEMVTRINTLSNNALTKEEVARTLHNIVGRIEDVTIAPYYDIAANTVVADFSLPYLCCSDCSPVNFIVPAPPVSLRLPAAHVCLDEDTQPLLFEVQPTEGIVKAVVSLGENGGVRRNDDAKFVFDPTLVSPGLYGKEITFTVNDQVTDCVIKVYKKPAIGLSHTVQYLDEIRSRARVIYTLSGDQLGETIAYRWTFGNEESSTESPNSDGVLTKEFSLPVNESNSMTTHLEMTNGICTMEASTQINFEGPIAVDLTLLETEICLDTSTSEPRVIGTIPSPAEATIAIADPITEITIDGTDILIHPSNFIAFDQEIGFTVAGETVSAKLTVRKKPEVGIKFSPNPLVVQQGDTEVTVDLGISNNNDFNEDLFEYSWNVGTANPKKGKQITHTFTGLETQTASQISLAVDLEVTGVPCIIAPLLNVKIPVQVLREDSVVISLSEEDFCEDDKRFYPFTITPDGSTVTIDGEGVVTRNGQQGFVPSTASTGTVNFTVDGNPSGVFVTVHSIPDATVFYTANAASFVIAATTPPEANWTYHWDIVLRDGNNNVLDASGLVIRNHVVSWSREEIPAAFVELTLTVGSSAGTNVECDQVITEVIDIHKISCEENQFGMVRLMHQLLQKMVKDGQLTSTNPILKQLVNRIVEEYAFFSREENQNLYEPVNSTTAIDRFNTFLAADGDWTTDTIKTTQDKNFFKSAMELLYRLATMVTQCADVDLKEVENTIAALLRKLDIISTNTPMTALRANPVFRPSGTIKMDTFSKAITSRVTMKKVLDILKGKE